MALRTVLYSLLILLYLLHNDLWFWNDGTIIAGLPVGLLYHVLFCGACMLLFALLIKYAWPLSDSEDGESRG